MRGTRLRSSERTDVLPRDEEGQLGVEPFVVHDVDADPYRYENLSGIGACPDLDAELRERYARYPWSLLEDNPR